jgi:NADH:ubiquinone oxidoreductase subunit E
LRDPVPVTEVDKNQSSKFAVPLHPSAEGNRTIGICQTEFPACMGSEHGFQTGHKQTKIQNGEMLKQ